MFFNKIFSLFQSNKQENYLINDPTTPFLMDSVDLPSTNLKYSVKDFKLSPTNEKEKRSFNCYVTIGNQINYFQKISGNLIKKWAGPSVLSVYPIAGNDLNAYYDRNSLKFFYFKTLLKTIYTSDSSDIVSHELGHALLDALRPDFWNVSALEIWSFHEAFADITSMVSIMQYDKLLVRVLEDTSNNVSKSNTMSRLGEEMGNAIYNYFNGKNAGYSPDFLRDSCTQKFKYVDPKTLPTNGKEDQLYAECHSFGKVFAAAWYEIFYRIYTNELNSKNPLDAIKTARDIAYTILVLSIPNAPKTIKYYESVAKSMCDFTKNKYPNYYNLINDVFVEYKILNSPIKILSNTKWSDIVYSLNKNDKVVKTSKGITVCMFNKKFIKLNEISALSVGALNNVEIEVPADSYYKFDTNGNLIDEILPSDQDIMDSMKFCSKIIQKSLGKEWALENNKLIRKYIS